MDTVSHFWRRLLWTAAAGAAGFAANLFPLPAPGREFFSLGAVFYLPISLLYGPFWGAAAALLAAPRAIPELGIVFSSLIGALEAGAIGVLVRRRWSPLVASIAYWAAAGAPLLAVLAGLHDNSQPWFLCLRSAVNGLFSVILAVLLLEVLGTRVPAERWSGSTRSLQGNFARILTLAATVPLILLALVVARSYVAAETERTTARLRDWAGVIRAQVDRDLRTHLDAITALTQASELKAPRAEALPGLLARYNKTYPGFHNLLVTDAQGLVIGSQLPITNAVTSAGLARKPAGTAEIGQSVSDRGYFKNPRDSGGPHITHAFRGRGTRPVVALSAPYFGDDGRFAGVVAGSLDTISFGRLDEVLRHQGLAVLLLDVAGQVVYASPSFSYPALHDLSKSSIVAASGSAVDQIFKFANGERYLAATTQTELVPWKVIVAEPASAVGPGLERFYLTTAVWVLAGIVISLLFARIVARSIAGPLEWLRVGVRQVTVGAPYYGLRLDSSTPSEIVDLASGMDTMAARVRESAERRERALAEREALNKELERLLADLDQQVQERTVELRRTSSLVQLLQSVAVAANEAVSPDSALEVAVHRICEHTGWPLGHVYVWNDAADVLEPRDIWHVAEPERFAQLRSATAGIRLKPGEGLAGRAFAEGRPVWVSDVAAGAVWTPPGADAGIGRHSGFAFPVRAAGEIVAVLEFFSQHLAEPDRPLLETLSHVASQIGRVYERQRAAAALRASEERHRLLFEGSPQPMWVFNLESLRILAVNDAAIQHYGYSRDEFLGMTLRDLRPPEDLPAFSQAIARLRPGMDCSGIWQHRKKNGSLIDVEITSHTIQFEGRPARFVQAVDVTERERAQRALAESQQRLKQAVEASNTGLWEWNPETNQAFFSPEWKGQLGYENDEMADSFAELKDRLHPDDRQRVLGQLNAYAANPAGAYEVEFRLRHRGGSYLWILSRAAALRAESEDGQRPAQRILGSHLDITGRKQAEQALRDSQQRYQELFETSPLPIFAWDIATTMIVAANEAALRQYGYTREVFLRLTVPEILSPGDPREFERTLAAIQQDPDQRTTTLRQHRRRDGSVFEVELVTQGVVLGGRKARQVIATDVSERRRSEEALRRSEQMYRSMIEGARCGILQTSIGGRILAVNSILMHMLGYSSEDEMIGLDMTVHVFRDPADRGKYLGHAEDSVRDAEVDWKRKDGSAITVLISGRVVRGERGQPKYFEAIIQDVTERRALEDRLRQAQKMEAVGRLAGGVAHDFNNLLTIITGYSEFLIDALRDNPVGRHANEIHRAAERAAALTSQLLAFSRQQLLQPVELDLNRTLFDLERMMRRLIGENLDVNISFAPNLGRIKADRGQIEQVVLNLALNARDAMPRGGSLVIATGNCEIPASDPRLETGDQPGPYVCLSVTDTGHGMAPETLARIFEPFFTTKIVGKGTGLGLATVYGIVRQSGGFIRVRSELHAGSSFEVYLPRVEPESVTPEDASAREVRRGSETVLLVEDEDMVRSLVRAVMEHSGYQVLEARNGAEALLLAERHLGPIELLVTDVVMPGLSGREVAERLLAQRPDIRILYMSGYTDEALGHHGVLDAGTAFLPKPFSREELARKLREVMDSFQRPTER